MDDNRINTYKRLIAEYEEYKNKENKFKKMKDEIRENINNMMHEDKTNNIKLFIDEVDKEMECVYTDRVTKKVDYVILSEYVADDVYNEIVKDSVSTFLNIKAAKVVKEKKTKPVDDDYSKTIKAGVPKGSLK